MARLFPTLNTDDIENPGERLVAKALVEQLPNKVEIFHSFNWLSRDRRGTIQEGESDFVLLDPENGILFVEVKGGSLLFDGREWVREVRGEHRSLNKDPFGQAQRGMHELVDLVERRFPDELPCTYGFAVAFPDCRIVGNLPPSIQPELILDAAKLRDVQESIRRIFSSFSRPSHRALSARELESVREGLYPKYELVPVVWRKIEDQEERLQRLTKDQKLILQILANQPKAAIRGVAGSGKTILALAKSQAVARDGKRTLLLCYNRPLKDWLQEAVPESYNENLLIDTYHGITDKLCKAANVPLWEMGNPKSDDFWTDLAPEALIQACERLSPEHKFDAVVVDEGQDFHDLWWTSLDSIFRDPENKFCYYVFYDPKQNLYVDKPSLPGELGKPFELPENCRNTIRIAGHCAALADYESKSRDGAPLGDEPELVEVRSLADAFREAGKRVRALCMPNLGGLKMSQVAVLAPGYTEKNWPAHFDTIPLTKSFEQWARDECVLIASWSRFKGLEADAVIIIETPTNNDANDNVHRYVAHSRAKHILTVINVRTA